MKNLYINTFSLILVLLLTTLMVQAQTSVEFSSVSASVTEDEGTFNLTISITNEDAGNATSVEVALTSGSATDIDNYITQTATFAASSAANETVTITITDDLDIESAETLTFTLQNVSGGNAAVLGGQTTFDLTIIENDVTASDLIINEIHADPASGSSGDANGDGVRSSADDEFIEFVNTGVGDLDVSGYEIFDTNGSIASRHVFPASTVIPAGGALVVFGAGSPTGTFGNSIVQVASSGGVGTTNEDETLIVQDDSDNTLIYYTYGVEGGDNQSITRDADLVGSDAPMTKHSVATGSGGTLFSPGTKIDGSFFIAPATTSVQFNSATATVNEGDGTIDLTVTILGEDAINATTAEVALTSGSAADVDNYTTQMVTFPAASSTAQTVTITLTDDADVEGAEDLVFTLQNVAGGNSAGLGGQSATTLTITDNDFEATALVINEFLPYPSSTGVVEDNELDANGDGSLSGLSDEFIELVNSGGVDLDISGWKYNDGADRHIFPASTVIPAGGALILFGGGTPSGSFGNSIVQTASESTSLGMSNAGDAFTINDDSDNIRLSYTYDGADVSIGVSFTRAPDITDVEPLGAHPENTTLASNGGGHALASPGTKVDGSLFIEQTTTLVQFSSPSITVNEGGVSFQIGISISLEDASNATSLDVALTSGDAADLNNYTTQPVTFPAASSTEQFVTITITDDSEIEGEQVFTFELQNVTGGNNAEAGANSTFTVTMSDNDFAASSLVLNEFLPYPSSTSIVDPAEVDANGDGTFGGTSDEFMEFVNDGNTDLNVSGWRILANDQNRHFFPSGTVIGAGSALIVFGGGTPTGSFGGASVQVASEAISGLGALNSGTTISIFNDADEEVYSYTYSSTQVGVSYTRNPDITGDFELHPALSGFTISPGTKVDGTPFAVDNSTRVSFITTLDGVEEADTTFDIVLTVENASASAATTADVVLSTDNSNGDVSYTTQTVTFPAGTSESQKVTVSVVNDEELEGDELYTFVLENISGGSNAKAGSISEFNFVILDDDVPLIFNEVHADPASGDSGDANNDGLRDAAEDEFIEVINRSKAIIDMSDYKFYDESQLRHIFPKGTQLQPGHALVVFGGGSPRGILGAEVQLASEDAGLGLTNTGDRLRIVNADEEIQASTIYGTDGNSDQSITRSADITGGYTLHTQADGSNGRLYSPGRKVDGSVFINIVTEARNEAVTETSVYPNPVSDFLEVSTSIEAQHLSFNLINLQGTVVKSSDLLPLSQTRIDISGMKDGLYVYQILDDRSNAITYGKLLIKR